MKDAIYQQARYWFDTTCLVLDTEASGGKNSDLIDIAVVHFPSGKILFDSLVYSSAEMNYHAQKIHGIQSYELRFAPKFHDVWFQLEPILKDQHIFAYNAAFDSRILYNTLRKYNLPFPTLHWHCLMKMYKEYRESKTVCKLSKACEELKVRAGNHRAKSDALAAARLLYRMAKS